MDINSGINLGLFTKPVQKYVDEQLEIYLDAIRFKRVHVCDEGRTADIRRELCILGSHVLEWRAERIYGVKMGIESEELGIDPDELAPEPPNLERALIAENFLMELPCIQLRNSSEFSAVCFLVAAKEYDGEVLFPSVEARRKMIKQGATPKKSRILPELPLAGDEDLADFVAPVKHYPTISMGYQNELRNCRLKLR